MITECKGTSETIQQNPEWPCVSCHELFFACVVIDTFGYLEPITNTTDLI